MRSIYKYTLLDPIIEMPVGSKIIKIALQNDYPTIWAEVDPTEKKKVKRTFMVFGTGHEVKGTYLETYFQGPFVWHIYELLTK